MLAWKRNDEIQPLANVFTQTSPPLSSSGSPAQYSEYSYPSYSPVPLAEFGGLDWSELDFYDPEPLFTDNEQESSTENSIVDRVLHFLENEENIIDYSPELP